MNQGIFLPPLALGTVTAPFSRGEEGSAQGPLQLQMTHAGGAPSSQLQQDEVFLKFFSELVLIQISITQSSLIATSTAQPRLGGVLQRQKSCRPKRTLPRCARACPLPPGSTLLPLPQRSQTTPACPEEAARLGEAPRGTNPAHPFGAWSSPRARGRATSAALPSWDWRCPARGAGAQLRLCSHFASGVSALCLFLPLPQRHRLQVLTDTR